MIRARRRACQTASRFFAPSHICARQYANKPPPPTSMNDPLEKQLRPLEDEKLQSLEEKFDSLGEGITSLAEGKAFKDLEKKPHAEHGDEQHHDHHEHDAHHHSEPFNEPLGKGFYFILGAIPLSMLVYTISRPANDGKIPVISKMMQRYSDYQEQWAARNALHTTMVEQAAHDRHLFQSAKGVNYLELRFNEIFNNGSPFNVSAGQQPRGMDELVGYYERKNREQDDNRIRRMEVRRARKEAERQRLQER